MARERVCGSAGAINVGDGEPHLSARLDAENDILSVHVIGPACLIAERAQQLAWLTAAFQHFPRTLEDTAIYSKPLVTKMLIHEGKEHVWYIDHDNVHSSNARSFMLATKWIGTPRTQHPSYCSTRLPHRFSASSLPRDRVQFCNACRFLSV
ncbi:hypothetical protein B0T21DRAFT_60637 [Apiosordaria backusii]|uniref:Uncharacterized protein n=1 Tax=Apiosordaria backusii TaxID=314023 RepID=A0AA40DZ50_9PEZI|nr:hypothetical protein B0T21DRAFT_60637 [Apiosordaria backusii]